MISCNTNYLRSKQIFSPELLTVINIQNICLWDVTPCRQAPYVTLKRHEATTSLRDITSQKISTLQFLNQLESRLMKRSVPAASSYSLFLSISRRHVPFHLTFIALQNCRLKIIYHPATNDIRCHKIYAYCREVVRFVHVTGYKPLPWQRASPYTA